MMRVFWAGFPGFSGGANTECWHTAKMLRQHGIEVTFIPTQGADLQLAPRLEGIGCKVVQANVKELPNVDGLKDSIVISMCNANFIAIAKTYRDLGCRIIWINCMTFCYPNELRHYAGYGKAFDAYVFQSDWQRRQIEPQLGRFDYQPTQGHLIRGAFDYDEFPFKPREHTNGKPFMVCKLSRAECDKYSSNLWPIVKRVPFSHLRFQAMAWNPNVEQKCGKPPDNAAVYESCGRDVQEFLGESHCMLHCNGGAGENWPRVGLEAMAAGVPIVAQNQWGWQEMVRNGRTGYLCSDDINEIAYRIAQLAYDEQHRMEIITTARFTLENELANKETIWSQWEQMLGSLAA